MAAIERQAGRFRVADLQRECPGVSIDLIRGVLKKLRVAGKNECLGRGQSAQWSTRRESRKRNHPGLRAKLAQIPVAEAGISVVTYGELVYGAFKSERRKENLQTIGEFIDAFQPLPLPVEAGQAYGRIKANLRAKRQIIGENDLWIAPHAFAEDYHRRSDSRLNWTA